MKAPFDIAADLDTPVSAYLKLAPFKPRFLLESVEGGERLARYSFIGFGECLEVKIDAGGAHIGAEHAPRPKTREQFLRVLRDALKLAPKPKPQIPGVPLLGGLVGYTAYDARALFRTASGSRSRRDANAACALPGTVLAAGVRSPDTRRRAAARWQRS